MSVDLIVFIRRSSMPTPTDWQKAITDAKFPVEIDTDFDPDTFSGFLPCKIRGRTSGFELFSAQLSEDERIESGAPAGSDFTITMVTHSDLHELACSLAAASALTRASGGLLVDPQSGESFSAANVIEWATQQFAEAEQS